MAGGIRYDDNAVNSVLQQLSGIESDTRAKDVFVSNITDALVRSTGETVAVALELNGIIGDILSEYDTLVASTRVMIAQMQRDFVATDQHIADGFREDSIMNFPR